MNVVDILLILLLAAVAALAVFNIARARKKGGMCSCCDQSCSCCGKGKRKTDEKKSD